MGEQSACDRFDESQRRFSDAGLTANRFGIEGAAPWFWGYHVPGQRWNGWATPRFCREVVSLIVDWVNEGGEGRAWWVGRTLAVEGDERVDLLEPDELGLYAFDGWVWLEIDADWPGGGPTEPEPYCNHDPAARRSVRPVSQCECGSIFYQGVEYRPLAGPAKSPRGGTEGHN